MSIETREADIAEHETEEGEPPRDAVPWVSTVLICLYAAVFAGQMITGLEPSILRAGEDKDAIVSGAEYWRLLTGSALHGSVLHIAMNTYAFYSFGKIFETLANRWHLPIVFLASAIAGSVLSLIVSPHGISVGASGGIVGIVGYLAVYSFKRRQFITKEFRRSLLINIGIILIYGFVLSVRVDNSAHIGGLLCGAAYAMFQVPSDSYADPTDGSNNIEIAGLVCVGVYAATCLFALLTIVGII